MKRNALSMTASLTIALISCAIFGLAVCVGHAEEATASNNSQSQRSLCVIEKAAGVVYPSGDAKEAIPEAISFEEQHKRFVLTVKRIVRSQLKRDMCRWSLSYWMPILSATGTFPLPESPVGGSSGDPEKGGTWYDTRYNIGRNCFASQQATIKFFDRTSESSLVSYDFLQQQFEGLPGDWLRLRGDNFEAGENLDAGPVIFTGKCQRIE
jgi:hypothetical protein